jgi:hypothetical protein
LINKNKKTKKRAIKTKSIKQHESRCWINIFYNNTFEHSFHVLFISNIIHFKKITRWEADSIGLKEAV